MASIEFQTPKIMSSSKLAILGPTTSVPSQALWIDKTMQV